MTDKKKCPSRKWLERLVDGNVTQEQESKLTRHLDRCETCRETLESVGEFEALTEADQSASSGILKKTASAEMELVERKLSEIRSNPPDGSSFKSGYADVAPWLGESDQHIGKIAEFDLVKFIGRGGMGLVFEAFDTKLHRKVAIKLMSPGLLADPSASQRFLREARAAAKINHVNVVTVHGVDQIRGLPYLVMELVSGKALDELLSKSDELPIHQILKIARQTALGLDAAHKEGITHRDIKPSNLMIDRESKRIKIADFGLASTLNDTSFTRSGMLVGTPDFASPEQVNSQRVDARSDLFSLGSVLYLVCTRELPFSEDSLVATLDSVRNRKLPRVDLNHKNIPAELATIVQRLMEKNPKDRYQSASELLMAIDEASKVRRSATGNAKTVANRFPWQWIAIIPLIALVPLAVALAAISSWTSKNEGREIASMTPPAIQQGEGVDGAISEISDGEPGEKIQPHEDEKEDVDEDSRPSAAENEETDSGDEGSVEPQEFLTIVAETEQQLIEAFDRDGDLIIKLLPGKTYRLDDVQHIERRDVVFESDPDDHAKVELKSFRGEPSLAIEDCSVTFRSIDIHNLSESDSDNEESVVACTSGVLRFEDVFFVADRNGNCIEIADSELVVKSSVLAAPETLVIIYPKENQSVTVVDSVMTAISCFEIGGHSRLNFNARDSQFINHQMFSLFEDSDEEHGDARGEDPDDDEELDEEFSMRFSASDSKFSSGKALLVVELDSVESRSVLLDEVRDRLEWEVEACELPEIPVFTEVEEEEEMLTWGDLGEELDPESEIVEGYEETANSLVKEIMELKFGSITEVKETIHQSR